MQIAWRKVPQALDDGWEHRSNSQGARLRSIAWTCFNEGAKKNGYSHSRCLQDRKGLFGHLHIVLRDCPQDEVGCMASCGLGSELLCRLSVTTSFSAARTELAIHRLILSLPLGHQLVQQMYGRHHFERMVWVFGSVWKSMAVQHVTRLECHSSQCKHGVFKRVCPRRKTRPKPTSMLRRGDPGTHGTHGIGVGPSLPCETSVV